MYSPAYLSTKLAHVVAVVERLLAGGASPGDDPLHRVGHGREERPFGLPLDLGRPVDLVEIHRAEAALRRHQQRVAVAVEGFGEPVPVGSKPMRWAPTASVLTG